MNALRVGVVGVRGMGLAHAFAVRTAESTELAAVCDIDGALVEKAGADFEVPAFTEVPALCASDAVDAVVIATPAGTHAALVRIALDAGKHVYCEKPITPTADEGHALAQHAADAQRVLQVGFQFRFHAGYVALRETFGDLGPLRRVHLSATNWFRPQSYFEESPWRATWRMAGGGVLMNTAVHQLDALINTVGMPSRVRARVRNAAHDAEVEDEAFAVIEWPGGAFGTFAASLTELAGRERFELHCDRGSLILEDGFDVKVARYDDSRRVVAESTEPFATYETDWHDVDVPRGRNHDFKMLLIAHSEFAASIAEGRPSAIDAISGTRSVELANAMYLSSITDAPVDLPLPPGAYAPAFEELASGHRLLDS